LGTEQLDLTISQIDLNMGAPLLTRTRCSSEDVLTDYVLTEDENQEEIENDVLVEDGETVSQDVFSSNDNWTLYINNIPFLKVRRYYMCRACTVTPNAEQQFQQSII